MLWCANLFAMFLKFQTMQLRSCHALLVASKRCYLLSAIYRVFWGVAAVKNEHPTTTYFLFDMSLVPPDVIPLHMLFFARCRSYHKHLFLSEVGMWRQSFAWVEWTPLCTWRQSLWIKSSVLYPRKSLTAARMFVILWACSPSSTE